MLGWCNSCSVGALETSAPPKCATVRVRRPIGFRPPSDRIPSAVRSDSVRRPIRFRPPSNRIPFAVRLDSVRRPIGFRPPSVEKCWEKRCKNVVLNGNTIGDFAIFDVSVFRCFYYPHPNNLCISVKSVEEYSVINSVSSAYSVGDHSVKPSMKSCFFVQFRRLLEKNAI